MKHVLKSFLARLRTGGSGGSRRRQARLDHSESHRAPARPDLHLGDHYRPSGTANFPASGGFGQN